MQRLNPIDAITPAFTRTHELLFKPFKLGRTWKLAFCQYFGLYGAFFVPLPLVLVFLPMPVARDPHLHVLIFGAITVGMLLLFLFFYLGVRMQFVNMQMILTKEQFIAPMWSRYGARVWPVILVKVFLGTVLYLAMLPMFWRAGKDLFHFAMSLPQNNQQPDPATVGLFFEQIIGFYALFFLAFFIFKVVSTLFEDFALPFYVLENVSLITALRSGLAVIIADPLQCLLYLGMKLLLSIVGFVMQYISNLIVLIPIFIVGMVVAAIGASLNAAMHGAGGIGHVLAVVVAVPAYLIFMGTMFWYQTGSLGYLFTLLEAYALYFLGGRYPMLGDILEPSAPNYTYTPPPIPPSPDEGDDSGGPSLPMDPALA